MDERIGFVFFENYGLNVCDRNLVIVGSYYKYEYYGNEIIIKSIGF